jgi:hypothetical protein
MKEDGKGASKEAHRYQDKPIIYRKFEAGKTFAIAEQRPSRAFRYC